MCGCLGVEATEALSTLGVFGGETGKNISASHRGPLRTHCVVEAAY